MKPLQGQTMKELATHFLKRVQKGKSPNAFGILYTERTKVPDNSSMSVLGQSPIENNIKGQSVWIHKRSQWHMPNFNLLLNNSLTLKL